MSQRWEGRGLRRPHISPQLQGASTHHSLALGCDTPCIPLPPQGPSLRSSCYVPAPLTPKPLWDAPVPEPRVASRRFQRDPCTQPLLPSLGAALAQLGPHRPQAMAAGQEPRWGAGGAGSNVLWLPRGGRHPGSPLTTGLPPGVQVGDRPALCSPDAPACPASPSRARCHLPSCSAAIFS